MLAWETVAYHAKFAVVGEQFPSQHGNRGAGGTTGRDQDLGWRQALAGNAYEEAARLDLAAEFRTRVHWVTVELTRSRVRRLDHH